MVSYGFINRNSIDGGFFVAAIVLIYLAVRSKRELERKRVDCTEAASGTVEKVRRISVSGESCNYYPTFAFLTEIT